MLDGTYTRRVTERTQCGPTAGDTAASAAVTAAVAAAASCRGPCWLGCGPGHAGHAGGAVWAGPTGIARGARTHERCGFHLLVVEKVRLAESHPLVIPKLDLEERILRASEGKRHVLRGRGHPAVLEEAPVPITGAVERRHDQRGVQCDRECEQVADGCALDRVKVHVTLRRPLREAPPYLHALLGAEERAN